MTRRDDVFADVDSDFHPSDEHLELAVQAQELGQYDEAERHYRQALSHDPEDAETARRYAELLAIEGRLDEARTQLETALDIGIDERGTEAEEERREAQRRILQRIVRSLRSELDRAEALADGDELPDARESLTDLGDRLDAVADMASRSGFGDLSEEIAALERRREDRLTDVTDRQREELADEVESIRSALDRAETLAVDGELADAREALTDLDARLDSAEETATEFDLDDLSEEIATLERRREHRLAAVTERIERREELVDEVASVRSDLDRVENLADGDDFADALDTLAELDARLGSAAETAVRHDFEDLHDEITALERRCEDRRTELTERKDRREELADEVASVRSTLDRAENLADGGDFADALDELSDLESRIDSAKETAARHDFDGLHEDIADLERRREGRIAEVTERKDRREELADEVASVRSALDRAADLADDGDLEDAREALTGLDSRLQSMKEAASEHELDDLREEVTRIERRHEERLGEITDRIESRTELSDEIASLRGKVGYVTRLVNDGDYEAADEALAELGPRLDSAEERAAALGFEDLEGEIAGLRGRYEDHLAEVTERKERREELADEVASIRSTLDRAADLADDGDFVDAREELVALESRVDSVEQAVARQDFDDLHEEVLALERRREDRLAEVTEPQETRVPETIPSVPDVAVEYDVLTDQEPLGRGGNADVTRATVPTGDGTVSLAVKEPRMSGTLHADAIDRVLAEAETWEKLDDHDHVVGVVDWGSEPLPWIAMEYMDGGHLGERAGEMDTKQALWTAAAVTDGVYHAHRRGIVHLDLKPENVLFRTVEDAWDVPKVADWGLSKHLLEHSKSIEGMSPHYAAPEQFEDDYGPTDYVTDVYQLGAVFYELFTGRPPFEGRPMKVMRSVMTDRPAPPSEVTDVPDGVDDILMTALAKDRDDRYGDILYLRDALRTVYERV